MYYIICTYSERARARERASDGRVTLDHIQPPGRTNAASLSTQSMCVCVRACVRVCVRVCTLYMKSSVTLRLADVARNPGTRYLTPAPKKPRCASGSAPPRHSTPLPGP